MASLPLVLQEAHVFSPDSSHYSQKSESLHKYACLNYSGSLTNPEQVDEEVVLPCAYGVRPLSG
jgi:hypothetical protein